MRYLVYNATLYRFVCYDPIAMVDIYASPTLAGKDLRRVKQGTPALTYDQILNTYPELLL